ncbi:hypothetical protein SLA2020_427630 [Shorea laevis]
MEARLSGGHVRQARCQEVARVKQVSNSSSTGVALQRMHTPSSSPGSRLTCAIGVQDNQKQEQNESQIERNCALAR